jgi:hypothetical protein
VKIFSAHKYVYVATYVQKCMKLRGIINNYFTIWMWKLVSHCSKQHNWSICEQGTEEIFSTNAERVNRIWSTAVFIISRYYIGETICLNKLDRSSGIHYKEINTYK